MNVGYGRKELARAAYEQLKRFRIPSNTKSIPAIKFAEKLNDWLEDDYVIFFSNSGSEANETAFKIARQYHQQKGEHGRYKFISRYRAYHGNQWERLQRLVRHNESINMNRSGKRFLHVSPPDIYRNPEDVIAVKSAAEIDRVMTWELSQTVAGVIMEPIITGGGILMPPDGYMERVKEICEKHGEFSFVMRLYVDLAELGRSLDL